MKAKNIIDELYKKTHKGSRWRVAVACDAIDLIEQTERETLPDDLAELETVLLNGAQNWRAYSYSGMGLIYDVDIAAHYCTNSELKRVMLKDGSVKQKANARENWADVQARALFQACELIKEIVRKEAKR
jgi:hypothetical protein